jgi:copper homeostasis protein (lipoprotein)
MKSGLIMLLALLLLGCSTQQAGIHSSSSNTLNAEFRYMADAPRILLCATGQSYPVAMKESYIELERAYLASGVEAGSPVWVAVQGYIDLRPAMEGTGTEEVFVVQSYDGINPDRRCSSEEPLLEGQKWQLLAIPGSTQVLPEEHMPFVQFDEQEKRISGFAGCNRFFGSYKRDGDHLKIGPLASTRMSCGKLDLLEHSFLQKLEQADNWQISDQQMKLLMGAQSLLVFQKKD